MNRDLTYIHMDLLRKGFDEWVRDLISDHKNVGEIMAEIWNQHAEDQCNDSMGLLDLEDREDFATLFIDGRYIEIAREKGFPPKDKRWVLVDNSYNDVIKEEDYHFFNESELIDLCRTEIGTIAECVIAWPSLYPRDFYEAIIWPIIKYENWIDILL